MLIGWLRNVCCLVILLSRVTNSHSRHGVRGSHMNARCFPSGTMAYKTNAINILSISLKCKLWTISVIKYPQLVENFNKNVGWWKKWSKRFKILQKYFFPETYFEGCLSSSICFFKIGEYLNRYHYHCPHISKTKINIERKVLTYCHVKAFGRNMDCKYELFIIVVFEEQGIR